MILTKIDLTYEDVEQLFQELGIKKDEIVEQKDANLKFDGQYFGVKDDTVSSSQTITYDIFALAN